MGKPVPCCEKAGEETGVRGRWGAGEPVPRCRAGEKGRCRKVHSGMPKGNGGTGVRGRRGVRESVPCREGRRKENVCSTDAEKGLHRSPVSRKKRIFTACGAGGGLHAVVHDVSRFPFVVGPAVVGGAGRMVVGTGAHRLDVALPVASPHRSALSALRRTADGGLPAARPLGRCLLAESLSVACSSVVGVRCASPPVPCVVPAALALVGPLAAHLAGATPVVGAGSVLGRCAERAGVVSPAVAVAPPPAAEARKGKHNLRLSRRPILRKEKRNRFTLPGKKRRAPDEAERQAVPFLIRHQTTGR